MRIMADVVSILDELQNKALKDEKLKQQLLATRTEADPLSAFCKTCRNLGYELYEMELIAAGEEFHAAMKRSTNGGGENSPMIEAEDDFYEFFLKLFISAYFASRENEYGKSDSLIPLPLFGLLSISNTRRPPFNRSKWFR